MNRRWVTFVSKLPPKVVETSETGETSRESIIASLLRLTLNLASIHSAEHPTKSDDITSVALLTLVTSVDDYLAREAIDANSVDGNIAGFVSFRINKAVRKYISDDKTIYVPQRTILDRIQKGTIDSLNLSVDTGTGSVEIDLLEGLLCRLINKRVNIVVNMTPDLEVRELLNRVIHTDVEKCIMDLRIDGFTDEEISEKIRVPLDEVRRKRLRIQHSLTRLLEE